MAKLSEFQTNASINIAAHDEEGQVVMFVNLQMRFPCPPDIDPVAFSGVLKDLVRLGCPTTLKMITEALAKQFEMEDDVEDGRFQIVQHEATVTPGSRTKQ